MGLVSYDRMTGEGIGVGDGGSRIRVPIAELRAAITARITELGLSEHLLWEYISETHTVAEDNAFYSLPFEDRIKRFRAEESADVA